MVDLWGRWTETNSTRDSSGQNGVLDDFGLSVVVYHKIAWRPERIAFPNVSQCFVVFPVFEVLLFGRWMSIICIDSFSVCLQKVPQPHIAHPGIAAPCI
jgi:hypothetical protein